MTQHVAAIYDQGVLRPLTPLNLNDQDQVVITVVRMEPSSADQPNRSLFDVFNERGLIGAIKDAPPDLSTNPLHYKDFGKSGN
jgi:predicted DNA-binding antitoxin AbrB/MazE fold protein